MANLRHHLFQPSIFFLQLSSMSQAHPWPRSNPSRWRKRRPNHQRPKGDMGVSKNRGGPPKWMVYNGKPYWNGWFGGPTPIFGNTHINGFQQRSTGKTPFWRENQNHQNVIPVGWFRNPASTSFIHPRFYTSQISRITTQVLYHQEFQVPKMEVLNLISLFWGWVFPYISLIYSLYSWVPPF